MNEACLCVRAAKSGQGKDDVGAALVAHSRAPEVLQPGIDLFHHPSCSDYNATRSSTSLDD